MSRLTIFRDEQFLEDHVLMRAVVALGRHPENDIVLDDRTLSRFHARLERRGDRYVVVDLGAQNGVYLNGTRITGECDLVPGDRIGLGRYVAIFDQQNADPARTRRLPSQPAAEAVKPASSAAEIRTEALEDISIDVDEAESFDGAARGTNEVEDGFDEEPPTTVERRRVTPTLVLLYNGLEISRHPVEDRPLIIGRSKTSDIVIGLLGLSRRHARVERRSDGIYVEDLGSQNGTWVNNARIEGPHRLRHGDLLNFYEYGLLFLENARADIGFSGASFDTPATSRDDLAARETDRQKPPGPIAPRGGEERGPTRRSATPILDEDAPSILERSVESELNGLDLGEGSYLDEAFDDPMDDELSLSLADAEPELESADAAAIAEEELFEFDDASTSRGGSLSLEGDKTTAAESPFVGEDGEDEPGAWPDDEELEDALQQQTADLLASLEVWLDDQLYTQMPLSNIVTRIGSDARCELALPTEVGVLPWHVTLVNFGAATVCYRGSARARVRRGGKAVDKAVLHDGDELALGRVRIVYRCR